MLKIRVNRSPKIALLTQDKKGLRYRNPILVLAHTLQSTGFSMHYFVNFEWVNKSFHSKKSTIVLFDLHTKNFYEIKIKNIKLHLKNFLTKATFRY